MADDRDGAEADAAVLAERLCSPDAAVRLDAVEGSYRLVRHRRGPYGDLIAVPGGRLRDVDPRVRVAVGNAFRFFFAVAAPAADDLAERVSHDPDLWNLAEPTAERGDLQLMARALAHLGDPRVLVRGREPHGP